MEKNIPKALDSFFRTHLNPFSVAELRNYLTDQKIKCTEDDVKSILYDNDFIFVLQNDMFISRAGAFTNRIFSFKPTLEEFQAEAFVPGHRFMPFLSPGEYPYNAKLISYGKMLPRVEVEITTNLAMDIHSLLGEGYIMPYIFDDPANDKFNVASFKQNQLPATVRLTGFSLKPLIENGYQYGDRIIGRVIDWAESVIEVSFLPGSKASAITESAMERVQWYKDFETGLLRIIEKIGPCASIESQLAYLFLEEQQTLCKLNCGSCEEFLKYTEEIGFKPYGVESRIWKCKEEIPYVGPWNRELAGLHRIPEIEQFFSEPVFNAIIKEEVRTHGKEIDYEELREKITPACISLTDNEKKFILLNLKKRTSIILKDYLKFNDIEIAPLRKRLLPFFLEVRNLMCTLVYDEVDLVELPQNSLIILVQISDHLLRMVEEMENFPSRFVHEGEEILLSIDGMMETLEDIKYDLKIDTTAQNKSIFKIVK